MILILGVDCSNLKDKIKYDAKCSSGESINYDLV